MRSWLCADALGDFSLNHDGHVLNHVPPIDSAFKQRGCDVVWKVADQMEWLSRKLDLQCVGMDDFDVCRHFSAKITDEISIDFYGNDASGGLCELSR